MVDSLLNIDPILLIVKALYKLVFVIYIIGCILNGSPIEDYLMQDNWAGTNWFPFFKLNNLENCKNLIDVCTSQRCLRHVFLKDEYEVYTAALKLGKFSKSHYLIMTFIAQSLAPFIYYLSIVGLPILGLALPMVYLLKLTQNLEGDAIRTSKRYTETESSTFQDVMNYFSSIQRHKITNITGIFCGMLATSILICPFCVKSYDDLKTTCETPLCLYCYPKLMHTIFKEVDGNYKSMFSMPTRLLLYGAKLVTVAVLICLMYLLAILAVSLTLWTFTEALWNVKISFEAICDYFSSVSPESSTFKRSRT